MPCIDGLAAIHVVHLAVGGEGPIVATISSLIALRVRIAVSAILSITVPASAILSTVARWFTSRALHSVTILRSLSLSRGALRPAAEAGWLSARG